MHFTTMNTMDNDNDNFAEEVVAFWERVGKMENLVAEEDKVSSWWKYFDECTSEEQKYQNYINCLYQIHNRQNIWTEEEIVCFKEYVQEYEEQEQTQITK